MSYYYIGLRLESPEKEKALEFRDMALSELRIELAGKAFHNVRENLMENSTFLKLVDHLQPGDTLLFHDIIKSTSDIYNALEVIATLNGLGVNMINMVISRVNNIDHPDMYEEVSGVLTLIQNYCVFLYHLCKGDVEGFNWDYVPRLDDVSADFAVLVEYALRYEIYNYQICSTVSEVFTRLGQEGFRKKFLRFYPHMETLTLTGDIHGLLSFLNFAKTV